MLETPERTYVPEQTMPRRTSVSPRRKLRRDFDDDFAEDFGDDFGGEAGEAGPRRTRGKAVKLRWRGLKIPATLWGRIAAGTALVAGLGVCVASMLAVRGMLLRDERFVVPDSSAIQIVGNQHLTEAQLLSVFGEDVGRNIFTVSLSDRQVELERLPWVQHATVMRLLPDHLRVSVTERTPVAFVRQGSEIGMVDANGVLLDMSADARGAAHYSFPVVMGIRGEDPLSVRAARMKLYRQFTTALDSSGEKISEQLSEIDLSNPEDVKALIPDKPADILVHFGDTNFLERYQKYQSHLAEWRAQYPKLASVDMRYDQQAVLQMQPGSDAPAAPAATVSAPATSAPKPAVIAKAAVVKPPVVRPVAAHPLAGKPVVRDNKAVPAKAAPKPVATASPAQAGDVSHWVTPDRPASPAKGKAAAHAAVKKKASAKPHPAAKSKAAKPVKAGAKTPLKQGAQ